VTSIYTKYKDDSIKNQSHKNSVNVIVNETTINTKTSYFTQLRMSLGHLHHVLLTVYSSTEHVTWKSPGPMCG